MSSLENYTCMTVPTDAAEATVALPPKCGPLTIPKKKTPAVVNAAAGKAVDPLLDPVHAIENYDGQTAIKRVFECEDKVAETYFELGGAMSVIQAKKWFQGCQSFGEWVKGKTGLRRSKAYKLIKIYDALVDSGLPRAKVSHIGWTKLSLIASVMEKDNTDYWIDIASNNSRNKLEEIVRQHNAKHNAVHPEMATTPTHRKTFALYHDQNANVEGALEKAMKEANTDVPSEALSLICIDYLNTMGLVEQLKACKLEAALTAFNEAFPHNYMEVVDPGDDDKDLGDGS